MQEITLDLTSTVIEAGPTNVNLEDSDNQDQPLRRRIIAVSEGVHNGIKFSGEEIRRMVQTAVELKQKEGREYFAAPLVLDHSSRFLDKVGATYNLFYDEDRKAAIADVEFWTFTPMLKEVAERVKRDPENTYFSVRVRGRLREDNSITDLQLIHIAVVLEPADKNARIIGELNKKEEICMFDREFEDKSESLEEEDLCKYGSAHHKAINQIASKLVKMGKLPGLVRKASLSDEECDFLDLEKDCKNPSETGWEMVGDTCSGWMDKRTGKELTWAEFKRRLAKALGIKPTQYIRNIFYAAWKQGLISTEQMRKLGYPVSEEKKKNLSKMISDFDLNNDEKTDSNMAEVDLQKEVEDLRAKVAELTAKIKDYDEKIDLMAEIIALDPQVDRDLLKSLNLEQLKKFKADLERRLSKTKTTEKSLSNSTKPDPFELALKYYGPIEGEVMKHD